MIRKKNKKNKRSPEYWIGFVDGVAIILILGVAIFIILLLQPDNKVLSGSETYGEVDSIIKECSNKTIVESANCVKDITKTFFKYNLSNIERDINFDVLKEEGGMCGSWSSYWCEIGNKLGYYTKEVDIDVGFVNLTYKGDYDEWMMGHIFCVWSDKDAYVVLDGIAIYEFKFNDGFFVGGEE